VFEIFLSRKIDIFSTETFFSDQNFQITAYNMSYGAPVQQPMAPYYGAAPYGAPYTAAVPPSTIPGMGYQGQQMGMMAPQYSQPQPYAGQVPYNGGVPASGGQIGVPMMNSYQQQQPYGATMGNNSPMGSQNPTMYGAQQAYSAPHAAYGLPSNSPAFVGYGQTMAPPQGAMMTPQTAAPNMAGYGMIGNSAAPSMMLQPMVPTPMSPTAAPDDDFPSGAALFADPTLARDSVKSPNSLLEELQKSMQPLAAGTPEKKPHEKASIADIKSLLSQVAPPSAPVVATPAIPVDPAVPLPVAGMTPVQMHAPESFSWGAPSAMPPVDINMAAPVTAAPASFFGAQNPVQPPAPAPGPSSDEEWGSWDGPSNEPTPRTTEVFASFGAQALPNSAPAVPSMPTTPALASMSPIALMPITATATPPQAKAPAPVLMSLDSMSVGASLFSAAPEPEQTPPTTSVGSIPGDTEFGDPVSAPVPAVEPALPTVASPVISVEPTMLNIPTSMPLASINSPAPAPAPAPAFDWGSAGGLFGSGTTPSPAPSLSVGMAPVASIPTIVTPAPAAAEEEEWAEFSAAPASGTSDIALPSQSLSPIPSDFFNSSTGSLGSSQTIPSQFSSSTESLGGSQNLSNSQLTSSNDFARSTQKEDDWAEFASAPTTTAVADPLALPTPHIPSSPAKSTTAASSAPLSDADLFAMLAAKSTPHTAPTNPKASSDPMGSPFQKTFSATKDPPKPTLAAPASPAKSPAVTMDLFSLDSISMPPTNVTAAASPSKSAPQPQRAADTPSKSKAKDEKSGSQWTSQQVPAVDVKKETQPTAPKTPSKQAPPASNPVATAVSTPHLNSVWDIDVKFVREAVDMPATKGPAAAGAKVASVLKGQAPQASEQEYALVSRWQAALVMILRELKRAESFFANIKQTIAHQTPNDVEQFIEIAKHLLQEDRIVDYIQGLVEVYKVSDRIQDCFFLNPPQFSLLESPDMPSLSGSLSGIAAAWKAVISSLDVLVGKGHKLLELPRAVDDSKKSKTGEESKLRCAVCATKLLRTEPVVKFGGKWSHSSCGNFWIHRVRPDVSEAL
jgi:hypothetical protein